VSTTVLKVRAIVMTVERCFAVNVLGMEVSMAHRGRSNLHTSPANR